MNKKVLLISYYWPPVAGGGVHRWLKMSKYLPDMGWDLHVYTPEPSEFTIKDKSLENEINEKLTIVKTPIWEPYKIYGKFTGKSKSGNMYSGFIEEKGKESITKKISLFIRGNFFIPDARRFWIKPSIKFLKKYIIENKIDYIISTGPPHSIHLIAYGLKKENSNIKWIADFRDPWSNINFYDKLKTTPWADKWNKSLELKVLNSADKIVTVSYSWANDFKKLSNRNDIEIITNGYDHQDFTTKVSVNKDKFTLIHIGSMNPDRNSIVLWKALKKQLKKDENFKNVLEIKLIGQVDFKILNSIQEFGLSEFLNKIDLIPHKQAIEELQKSQVLILPINNTPDSFGVLPGKLYEYLATKKPIFCICPEESDAHKIINESKAGETIDYNDESKAFEVISKWYNNYKNGLENYDNQNIEKFSRKNLAKEYANLLSNL